MLCCLVMVLGTNEDTRLCCCSCLVAKSCLTLQPHRQQSTTLLSPWDSLGRNTGMGRHFLLQGDLLDPGIEFTSLALGRQIITIQSQPVSYDGPEGTTIHQSPISTENTLQDPQWMPVIVDSTKSQIYMLFPILMGRQFIEHGPVR